MSKGAKEYWKLSLVNTLYAPRKLRQQSFDTRVGGSMMWWLSGQMFLIILGSKWCCISVYVGACMFMSIVNCMYSYYWYTTKHACLMVLVHLASFMCKPNSGLADCNQRSPYSTIKTNSPELADTDDAYIGSSNYRAVINRPIGREGLWISHDLALKPQFIQFTAILAVPKV